MNRYKIVCSHCKSHIEDVNKSIIVDEHRPTPFCSEKCVDTFYQSEIEHFKEQERDLRRDLQYFDTILIDEKIKESYLKETLKDPAEIWEDTNPLGDKYYYLLKEFPYDEHGTFHFIIVCKVFNSKPSFILHYTLGQDLKFISFYRTSKKIKGAEPENGFEKEKMVIPQEILNEIQVLRSEYFAQMLERRKESDIKYEYFPLYEKFLKETLDSPDEVYEQDENDTIISTSVKSAYLNESAFFYYVIGMKIKEVDNEVVLPIFSFPTTDLDLCKFFNRGELTFKQVRS